MDNLKDELTDMHFILSCNGAIYLQTNLQLIDKKKYQ
jgi:hypothetical protein